MRITKRLIAGLGVFLSVPIGASVFLAELAAVGPRALIDREVASQPVPLNYHWKDAYDLLKFSALVKPWDADLKYELARLAWWQALHPDVDSQTSLLWLQTSVDHMEDALSLRPTWGRVWAELSYVRLLQGEVLLAHHNFLRALHYEPYDAGTQRMILATGFAIWPMLYGDHKQAFMKVIKHVLENYWIDLAIVPAVYHGREEVIREYIEGNTRAQELLDRQMRERQRGRSGE